MSAFMMSDDAFRSFAKTLATLKLRHHDGEPLACTLRQPKSSECLPGSGNDLRNPSEVAYQIVKDWYRANRAAIGGRYGQKAMEEIYPIFQASSTLRDGGPAIVMTKTQIYKLTQSLACQCSEYVAPSEARHNKRIRKELETLQALLAADIVESSPDYDDAGWSEPEADSATYSEA